MLEFPKWKIGFVIAVCLWAIYVSISNFVSQETKDKYENLFSEYQVNLGLDLQGGSYLLMQIDFDSYYEEKVTQLLDEAKDKVKEQRAKDVDIGFRRPRTKNGKAVLELEKLAQKERMLNILADLKRDAEINISETGTVTLQYREKYIEELKSQVLSQTIEIIRKRIDQMGTKEPIIQRQGEDRILIQVPGEQNPERIKRILTEQAKMTFHLMDEINPFPTSKSGQRNPSTTILDGYNNRPDDLTQQYYMIKNRTLIEGDMLTDARAIFQNARPVINFKFNTIGAKKFAKITRENVNKPFAIVLDGKVLTAPNINEPIVGGSGIISGDYSLETANDLALLMRAGALPTKIEFVEERTVGPSLGKDSINSGKNAAIVGFVLVIISMFFFYRLFGLFSNIALMINLLLVLALLSLFNATLTLPGIAGLVLTLGMAVDANVLIFERIKEELRLGKTPYASVDLGFRQAFRTIVDSNTTTLIAAMILFMYGSGPVRGFAVTLSIGIICSMFSAILLTRMMIVLWIKKTKPDSLPIK